MSDRAESPANRIGAVLAAGAVGIAGLLGIVVWLSLLVSSLGIDPSAASIEATVVTTVAGGLGTASIAAVYFAVGDLGRDYLDLSRPTLRGIGYVIGGTVLLLVLNVAVDWGLSLLGVEMATHSIVERARENPRILLVNVPLAYLVIAPGEELLYRNVVQKSLYDAFSKRTAILLASVIFAVAHFSSYLGAGALLATLGSLFTVLALSVVLGWIYARTENLLIAILVHGSFDAVAFVVTYVKLT